MNNEDDGSLYRVINIPRRGIGDKTIDKIKQYAEDDEKVTFGMDCIHFIQMSDNSL